MAQSLFRSIRMKLLDEGKTVKYLKYAIGEILLIIVGILIAVQISNWNEDRKAQVEFDEYVVQLRGDVRKAIDRAQSIAETTKENSIRDYKIIEFLDANKDSDPDLNSFRRALRGLSRVSQLNIHVGYLGRLLSGDFEIIGRNQPMAKHALELQSSTSSSLATIDRIIEGRKTHQDIADRYFILPNSLIPEINMSYDLHRMKGSEEFINAVHKLSNSKFTYSYFADKVVEDLESFLAVLEEYE